LNKLFKAICNRTRKTEPNITDRAIRYRIENYKNANGIASTQLSELAYANRIGMSIDKLVTNQELSELQNWLSRKHQNYQNDAKPIITKRKISVAKVPRKIINELDLPPNIIADATKMADIYPDLYLFENLIRHVIITMLEKKYTLDWWQNRNVVSAKIADTVEIRKNTEKNNRWVAKRGKHEIFYTDFKELARIISLNINDFKKIFGDMEIEAELRKLEPLRNIIAHNNPLPQRDIVRIRTALADLREQLKGQNI
jgi:hypothetical protein